MTNTTLNIQELKTIVDWVKLTDDVREISFKFGDVELFMSRNENTASPQGASVASVAPVAAPNTARYEPSSTVPAAAAPTPVETSPVAAQSSDAEPAADEVVIKAPMVGVFYEAPRPGEPAFVVPGDTVSEDTVLGIVEVMKLMNNIEAKVEGVVDRILVKNGEAVEYGQPLIVLRRNA